jgi:hypothetical protein
LHPVARNITILDEGTTFEIFCQFLAYTRFQVSKKQAGYVVKIFEDCGSLLRGALEVDFVLMTDEKLMLSHSSC